MNQSIFKHYKLFFPKEKYIKQFEVGKCLKIKVWDAVGINNFILRKSVQKFNLDCDVRIAINFKGTKSN